MQAVEEKLTIKVVKRDGKKVDFDASKIAIAIKKGFDSITNENDEPIYDSKDANKVFTGVMNRIDKEYKNEEKIKIETIQDLIEEELQKKGYEDVYKSFSEYRDRRAKSRELFSDEKRAHKFFKTIEGLGLKSTFLPSLLTTLIVNFSSTACIFISFTFQYQLYYCIG